MAALIVEYGEYAIADAHTYIRERTTTDTETELVERLFLRWRAQRTSYGFGYLPHFLTWLAGLGFELAGYHGQDGPWSGHTGNTADTLLDDDFGWTYLFIGKRGPFVAIEWDSGWRIHTVPTFYKDTSDDTFLDWSRGTLWCTGPGRHAFATEDSVTWTHTRPDGEPTSIRFKLHELPRVTNSDGDETRQAACPICGRPILTGQTW